MADVAQLVRALVCGTRCRRFESDLPPHKKNRHSRRFFVKIKQSKNTIIALRINNILQLHPKKLHNHLKQPHKTNEASIFTISYLSSKIQLFFEHKKTAQTSGLILISQLTFATKTRWIYHINTCRFRRCYRSFWLLYFSDRLHRR